MACEHPLPLELDEREAHVLAVVGINGAGKSHYLAAALTEATRSRGVLRFGCSEFSPVEDTATRLHSDYYTRVFRERQLLEPTQVDEAVRHKPLIFNVTMSRSSRMLLFTHDISGEVLSDHRQRAAVTPFLRRSNAVVFLLDPLEFDRVRDRVPTQMLPPDRSMHQVDLLRACLAELSDDGPEAAPAPVCIVLAKIDLLSRYVGIHGPWMTAPEADVRADIKKCHLAVKETLAELGEHEILDAAESYGNRNVTFHAVSSLGSTPNGTSLETVQSIRCCDPLGTALVRMTRR